MCVMHLAEIPRLDLLTNISLVALPERLHRKKPGTQTAFSDACATTETTSKHGTDQSAR